MRVFNKEKTEELMNYNLNNGYLREERLLITHHAAVKAKEGKWHYETIAEYDNGGKDIKKVWDVEPIEAKEAWDEYEDIQVYIPFSDTELSRIEIGKLKAELSRTDYQAIKYAEGIITPEAYEPIKAQRQAWRERINELEKILDNGENM